MPTVGTTCLVCGYSQMEPLELGVICPSCGTEYGVSDEEATYPELRQQWIAQGLKWWSRYTPPPHWSPIVELRNAGYEATPDDLHLLVRDKPEKRQKVA